MSTSVNPTPTINSYLKLRAGGFRSLIEMLEYAAQGETGLNIYSNKGDLCSSISYAELKKRSIFYAEILSRCNLKRGSLIGLLGETSESFFTMFFACQYSGMVPCILPYRVSLGARREYVSQIKTALINSGVSFFIFPDSLSGLFENLDGLQGIKCVSFSKFLAIEGALAYFEPLGANDAAYVQFSSGSTSQPKGILISQRAICSNVSEILKFGMHINCEDRAFSWLPMYHDMGLVGFFLSPLAAQRSVDYLTPVNFAKRPALWFSLMSANSTSITYGPAFSYRLAASRLDRTTRLNLSRLRIAGVGGELIRYKLLRDCTNELLEFGFNEKSWLPSYGMAESCLAVSIGEAGRGLKLSNAHASKDLKIDFLVCSGLPLPGVQIKLIDNYGELVKSGEIGKVCIKSQSLMDGYLFEGECDKSVFDDGFLDTGDLGYWDDGQLVICGRVKELIKIRGRNVNPQDVEWSLVELISVSNNDVVAFSVEADEGDQLVVLIQGISSDERCRKEAIWQEYKKQISRMFGIVPKLYFLPSKSIPVTSSGKLARIKARDLFLAGAFSGVIFPN